jgi:hypothetical protein
MHVDIDVLSNPLFPDDKHVLSPLPVHILHSKALSGSPCFCFWEIKTFERIISPVMEEIERISSKEDLFGTLY